MVLAKSPNACKNSPRPSHCAGKGLKAKGWEKGKACVESFGVLEFVLWEEIKFEIIEVKREKNSRNRNMGSM